MLSQVIQTPLHGFFSGPTPFLSNTECVVLITKGRSFITGNLPQSFLAKTLGKSMYTLLVGD